MCFSSCKERTSNTDIFNEYLKNVFNYEIPNEEATFVIIPRIGCSGCMVGIVDVIKDSQLIHDDKVSLILANDKFQDDWKSINVFVDSFYIIEEYNIPISSITIIETNVGKVDTIINLNDVVSAEKYF